MAANTTDHHSATTGGHMTAEPADMDVNKPLCAECKRLSGVVHAQRVAIEGYREEVERLRAEPIVRTVGDLTPRHIGRRVRIIDPIDGDSEGEMAGLEADDESMAVWLNQHTVICSLDTPCEVLPEEYRGRIIVTDHADAADLLEQAAADGVWIPTGVVEQLREEAAEIATQEEGNQEAEPSQTERRMPMTSQDHMIPAYKGFRHDLTCLGFQYAEGETYQADDVELCEAGFHACPMPLDTLRHYPPATSVYHAVKVAADAQQGYNKMASQRIEIGRRMTLADLIKAHLSLVFERVKKAGDTAESTSDERSTAATSGYRSTVTTSGQWATAATSGYLSTAAASSYGTTAATSGYLSTAATSGDRSTAAASNDWTTAVTSGNESTAATSGALSTAATSGCEATAAASGYQSTAATSGYGATAATSGSQSTAAASGYGATAAASGYRSTAATSGDRSTAAASGDQATAKVEGQHSIALAGGRSGRAMGSLGCWLVLAERDQDGAITHLEAVQVDGKRIKPDVAYMLRDGQVVEA